MLIFANGAEVDYMDTGDALARRHNLRVDAMRYLDAARYNLRPGTSPAEHVIARRQRFAAIQLIDEAWGTK